jgi:hypothetical protein
MDKQGTSQKANVRDEVEDAQGCQTLGVDS